MRNYCRYLLTIFLMLPVLVSAVPTIILSNHNGREETFKPSGNGSEFNLKNHENKSIEVSQDLKYTISGQPNTFFEIKKNKNQWELSYSEDIGVYKSGNTLKAGLNRTPKSGTKRILEGNETVMVSYPRMTAVIGPESPIANASSVLFVVAPQHQQFFSNIASQVTAINTYAETSVFDISKFANDQVNSVITGHIWQDNIAKFINSLALSNFMKAAGGREKNKVTLVFDLNLHGGSEQKDFYMSLINKINESITSYGSQIVNITFLSLSFQQDEKLVDELTRHAQEVLKLNGKNETVHHRVLQEVNEKNIADAMGINFQFTQQNAQVTSSEPTQVDRDRELHAAQMAAHQSTVEANNALKVTQEMQQQKLRENENLYPTDQLQRVAAESNQVPEAEENEKVTALKGEIAKLDLAIKDFNAKVEQNAKFLTSSDQDKRDKALKNVTVLNEKIKELKTEKVKKETELVRLQTPSVEEPVIEGYEPLSEDEE